MDDLREKVIKGLECLAGMNEMKSNPCMGCGYQECQTYAICIGEIARDALSLLQVREQEISRLKHHIDCDAAEKIPSGCVGFGRGFNDDEPCETCKECEKYNGYGEE